MRDFISEENIRGSVPGEIQGGGARPGSRGVPGGTIKFDGNGNRIEGGANNWFKNFLERITNTRKTLGEQADEQRKNFKIYRSNKKQQHSHLNQENPAQDKGFMALIGKILSGVAKVASSITPARKNKMETAQKFEFEKGNLSQNKAENFQNLIAKYQNEKPLGWWSRKMLSYSDGKVDVTAQLTGDTLPQLDVGPKFSARERYLALMVAEGKFKPEDAMAMINEKYGRKDGARDGVTTEEKDVQQTSIADLEESKSSFISDQLQNGKSIPLAELLLKPEGVIIEGEAIELGRDAEPKMDGFNPDEILGPIPEAELVENSLPEKYDPSGTVQDIVSDKNIKRRKELIQDAINNHVARNAEVSGVDTNSNEFEFVSTRRKEKASDVHVDVASDSVTESKPQKEKILFRGGVAAHNRAVRKKGDYKPGFRQAYNKGMRP